MYKQGRPPFSLGMGLGTGAMFVSVIDRTGPRVRLAACGWVTVGRQAGGWRWAGGQVGG